MIMIKAGKPIITNYYSVKQDTVKHLNFAACFFRELTISDNFAAI